MKKVFLLALPLILFACNTPINEQAQTWNQIGTGWDNTMTYRPGDDKAIELDQFMKDLNSTEHREDNYVVICHKDHHTIAVDDDSLDAHLAHGDAMGECAVEETEYPPDWPEDPTPPEEPVTPPTDDGGEVDLGGTVEGGNTGCTDMEEIPVTVTVEYLSPNAPTYQGYPNYWMGTNMQYKVTITNNSNVDVHHLEVANQMEYHVACAGHAKGDLLAGEPIQVWTNVRIPAGESLVLYDYYLLSYQNVPTFFQAHVIVRQFSGSCVSGVVSYNNPQVGIMYDPIPE